MLPDRDTVGYPWHARPDDHSIVGLFLYGPRGELSVLAALVYFTYCARPDLTSPDAERKQRVTYRGRAEAQKRAELGDDYAYIGRFRGPKKPAASGRKRKVAA